jgi:thymidylate synthase (FAD)
MKLIKPSYTIIKIDDDILKQIEIAARTCYKSENRISKNKVSALHLVRKLLEKNHEAMLEFGDITVQFISDRGFSHEMVRMRLCSFAQESTRYCNYSKNKFGKQLAFIIPAHCNLKEGEYKSFNSYHHCHELSDYEKTMLTLYEEIEASYMLLINNGASPQQARSVLPIGIKTEIVVKANIREWRHILKLRTSEKAHPEMQRLMRPLLDELKSTIPLLFDDITY